MVYLPFRLFDLISLRFLYQRALWLYNTNVNRWKLLAGLSVFLVLAFFYSYGAIYRTLHWHNIFDQRDYRWQLAPGPEINQRLYRDEAGDDKVTFAQIPSKLIDNSYLEVFMVYRKRYDNFMPENGADTTFISDLAELSVNDSVYYDQLWHPTWRRENDQLGITAMVPIHHLKTGPHVLRLISKADTTQQLVIPFWKEEK